MRSFLNIVLILSLAFCSCIVPSYAATSDAAFSFRSSLFSVALAADSSTNPNAFPYWVTSSSFSLTSDGSYTVTVDPSIRYLVGVHPASDSNYWSFLIFSYSDLLTSDVSLTFSAEPQVVSGIASYPYQGNNFNYRYIWIPKTKSPNASIPVFDNLASDASALASYASQSYDLDDYIWKVPKLSSLDSSVVISDGVKLRQSSPFLCYGGLSNNLFRVLYKFISNLSISFGSTYFFEYIYSDIDVTSISSPIFAYQSSSGDVITVSGSQFSYDDSLSLWYYSFCPFYGRDAFLDVHVFNDLFSLKSSVAEYFSTTFKRSGFYSLPAGNVLYIDLGSSGTQYNLDLSVNMPVKSSIFGSSPFNDSQYYYFSDNLPSSGDAFVYNSQDSYVSWAKGDDRSFIGQTKKAVSNISGSSSGRYLVLVNPLYYGYINQSDVFEPLLNGSVSVSGIPVASRIYSYPLNYQFNSLDPNASISYLDGVGGSGTVSNDGGNVGLTSNNNPEISYSAPIGGTNDLTSSQYDQAFDQSLSESLSGFFNRILDLLGKPVFYIQSLISSAADLITSLSGFWSWLPPEVSSVIVSALVIVISVAVFKVFL